MGPAGVAALHLSVMVPSHVVLCSGGCWGSVVTSPAALPAGATCAPYSCRAQRLCVEAVAAVMPSALVIAAVWVAPAPAAGWCCLQRASWWIVTRHPLVMVGLERRLLG